MRNPEFQAPSDETIPPYVDGNPLRISPEHTVKDAYLLMKMSEQGVARCQTGLEQIGTDWNIENPTHGPMVLFFPWLKPFLC